MSKGPEQPNTPSGGVTDPEFVRVPDPTTLFRQRADRLSALAQGNPLGPYLAFLSAIAEIQHRTQQILPPPARLSDPRMDQRLAHAMPPLAKEELGAGDFSEALDWLSRHAQVPGAPDAAEQARMHLIGMPASERLALAESVFEGSYPAEQLGEALYVAASLQVYLSRRASTMDPAKLKPVADGVCPVCGGMPVASVIVAWAKADHARYCCCGLCGSMWNYVRIKCTACASTAEMAYYRIEEQSEDMAVETCGVCRGYIKHLHQHRNQQIEPVADDIGSFALDLLVREKGFHRTAINPMMVIS